MKPSQIPNQIIRKMIFNIFLLLNIKIKLINKKHHRIYKILKYFNLKMDDLIMHAL